MLEKYDGGASKDVYMIVTGDKSLIYAYESDTKQQSTMCTSKQMVACFFRKTGHAATVSLEQRCTVNSEWYTTISLEKFEKRARKDKDGRTSKRFEYNTLLC